MIHSLSLPEGRIHAETDGTGPTIVFVHADFVDGRLWDGLRAILAPRYRTVVYDKLGYGRSDPVTGPVVRRRELAAVVGALCPEPFHLVGCSNGGQQALDYTLENPARVRSLTLVNASPSGWVPQGAPPPVLLAMIAALQKGDLAAASELQIQLFFDGPERSESGLSPQVRRARSQAAEMNRIFVDRGTYFLSDANPAEPLDPPALGRLGEIRVSTLVVDGRRDWPENRQANRYLAEGIPGCRLIEVDAGHVPAMEDPEGFAAFWESAMRPGVQ